MNEAQIGYWLTWIGTGAWGFCFLWMHRISSRQDRMLAELRDQARRIEKLARTEHDILKEVRPDIDKIREGVAEVTSGLDDVRRDNVAQAEKTEQVVEQVNKIERAAEKIAGAEDAVGTVPTGEKPGTRNRTIEPVGAAARFGDLCG